MIFTIQTFLEDFCNKRGYLVSDAYVIELAKLYFHERTEFDETAFLKKMSGINTVFFSNNDVGGRKKFEKNLLKRLDKKYKKKINETDYCFPGGIQQESQELSTINEIDFLAYLSFFRHAIQSRAIDGFWKSRKKGNLKLYPEKIAQSLFGAFSYGVLRGRGVAIREAMSGIGYVDFYVVIGENHYLVEVKVLSNGFEGPNQLFQYMANEGHDTGYLLVFDARPPSKKDVIPTELKSKYGIIKIVIVDINPPAPHSLN